MLGEILILLHAAKFLSFWIRISGYYLRSKYSDGINKRLSILCINYKYRVHKDRRLNWDKIRVFSAT
jgi:hypothetical protein